MPPAASIAADSLAPKHVGELMFPTLWDRLRIVAEPGGATAFAALLAGKYVPTPNERVAVLLCGANTTAVRFD